MAGERKARLISVAALICALASIPFAVNLGLLCAVALSVWMEKIQLAMSVGLALELAGDSCCAAALTSAYDKEYIIAFVLVCICKLDICNVSFKLTEDFSSFKSGITSSAESNAALHKQPLYYYKF